MSKQKAILRRLRQLERVFTVPSDDNVVIEILEGSHPQADLADRLTRRGDLSVEEGLDHLSLVGREDVGSHGPSQLSIVGKPLNKPFPYIDRSKRK